MMGPLDFGNQEHERDQNERVGRSRRDEREAVTAMCVARARRVLIDDLTHFLLAFHLLRPPKLAGDNDGGGQEGQPGLRDCSIDGGRRS